MKEMEGAERFIVSSAPTFRFSRLSVRGRLCAAVLVEEACMVLGTVRNVKY